MWRIFSGGRCLCSTDPAANLIDHTLGVLGEIEPGEAKHLIAGQRDRVLLLAVVLERLGHTGEGGEPDTVRAVAGASIVTLVGQPSELMLYAHGRTRVAERFRSEFEKLVLTTLMAPWPREGDLSPEEAEAAVA